MLGFGGHFLTKGRYYSVTFTALRAARIFYRRTQDTGPEHEPIRTADHTDDEETTLVVGNLSPTPEPAGKPPATPSSPAPPPTRPENAAKPDARKSRANAITQPVASRPHNPASAFLTLKRQNNST